MIGRTIGHYKIIDKLGEGGMGAVYKAEDTTLHRLVALKSLSSSLADDEEARERFVREAQAASSMNHANITTIHELLEDEGEYFICMEFVEGKTIRDMVESGRVSVKKAVDIIIQAAEALERAHNKGILHRDVKSANIMVTMEGQVKLMDFGLAHLEERSQLTRTGTTLGTLSYCSPEQITGRSVDRRSEIFSLGVVFYELLTGRLPFGGTSEAEIVFAIVNNEPEPISKLREEVPELLEAIVSRMLDKGSDLRYPNCAELIDDLKALQNDFETTTVSISTQISRRLEARSKRTWIWGGIAGAAVVVGLILVGIFSAGDRGVPRIAVMPFENVGPAVDEFFADGITIDLNTRLVGLQGLEPIDRYSTIKYRGSGKSAREIGNELDVDYLLYGTVRWQQDNEGTLIRVSPSLVRVSDGTEIWSGQLTETYAEAFQLQSRITARVVQELNIELVGLEQLNLERQLTGNTDALMAYLRGRQYAGLSGDPENCYATVEKLQEAVDLDPEFAVAFAELAKAHARIYHWGYDRSSQRRIMADAAAERAMELAPDLPEVQSCVGYYHYWVYKDYERALEAFAIAEKDMPNDFETIRGTGAVLRRQGKFEEALEKQISAFHLNPLSASDAMEIGITMSVLRRFEAASEYCELSIDLDPAQVVPYAYYARIQISWDGSLGKTREILDRAPDVIDPLLTYARWLTAIAGGEYQQAQDFLDSFPGEVVEGTTFSSPKYFLRGITYRRMGESGLARQEFERTLQYLEARVEAEPFDPRPRATLGVTYALLGRKEDAVREGELVVNEIYPVSFDAFGGPEFVQQLAQIYALVGEYDRAIDQLEMLLTIPSFMTVPWLELDPFLDPLRDNPRYQRLIEQYR